MTLPLFLLRTPVQDFLVVRRPQSESAIAPNVCNFVIASDRNNLEPALRRFPLQQTPQPPAGPMQLRFRAAHRTPQNSRDFAVLVSCDVVEKKVSSIAQRQLAQRPDEIKPVNGAGQ